MFGHGVFDSPIKTFRNEDDVSAEVYYFNEPRPAIDDYSDEDAWKVANDTWEAKSSQLMGILEGMLSNALLNNHGIGWCFQSGFGPYVHWKHFEKDDDGNYTIEKNSGKEVATLVDEGNITFALQKMNADSESDIEIWRDSCDDLGIEHESFDYGPSGGSGDAGDSDDEEEPEDPTSAKSYYLPILLILVGGAAYYYKDQIIQVSKRIM